MNTIILSQTLQWIIDILRKHDIPFQITGGLAAHAYGSTREVNDIDIDVPEGRMREIVPDVEPYIEFGPGQYVDERWDLLLMNLNYKGQLIDICGAEHECICDARTSEWKHIACDLSDVRMMTICGIMVPVMNPRDLFTYKQMLIGDHQKQDIAAVQRYMKRIHRATGRLADDVHSLHGPRPRSNGPRLHARQSG